MSSVAVVIARGVVGGRVTIVAAIPAQGFHTGGLGHGAAAAVSLTFESADDEYTATVTCDNGSPVVQSAKDDGHRRGRGGRG